MFPVRPVRRVQAGAQRLPAFKDIEYGDKVIVYATRRRVLNAFRHLRILNIANSISPSEQSSAQRLPAFKDIESLLVEKELVTILVLNAFRHLRILNAC